MKVLVDTPVWSYALRKQNADYQHVVFPLKIYNDRIY